MAYPARRTKSPSSLRVMSLVNRGSTLPVMLHFMLRDQLAQHAFQFRHASRQVVDRLAFRIGKTSMVQVAALGANPHHAARNPDHRGIVGHRVYHHRTRAHLHVIADPYVTQDLRAGPHHNTVADGGMALAPLVA